MGELRLHRISAAAVVLLLVAVAGAKCCPTACPEEPSQSAISTSLVQTAENRFVEYYWYDMFNVSFGEYWNNRWEWYGLDEPISDSYPYIFRRHYYQDNYSVYSNAKLRITGRNMPELNMMENPEFLPMFGDERGGTSRIDWNLHYVTDQEFSDGPWPQPTIAWSWNDGWILRLTGTIDMDMQAAKTVMNLTDDQYYDFDTWWLENGYDFRIDYMSWLEYEAGQERLDIFPMYEYQLTVLWLKFEAERSSEGIILSCDMLSWGMEALLTRWMHEAFMPTEWYFEDTNLSVVIGPDRSDLDMDTAVAYALMASATRLELEPCWVWQGLLQDTVPSNLAHPYSSFDNYEDLSHVRYSPGSADYGQMVPYETVPGSFNLSEGETLIIDIPEGDQLFERHIAPGEIENYTGPMVCAYAEPMWSDLSEMDVDGSQNRVTFTGPIDFWTWSKDQTDHLTLSDEWDRLGVLPYGMPYIELSDGSDNTPPTAHVEVSPEQGYTNQSIAFDASGSQDAEDEEWLLRYRWDWESDGTYDTNWTTESSTTHAFSSPGEHVVTVQVVDSCRGFDEAAVSINLMQHVPCVTTATTTGTEGENGWYVSPVSVALTVSDGSVPSTGTFCRLGVEEWQPYEDVIYVDSEGTTVLEFYSVDALELPEEVRNITLKIDETAPILATDSPNRYDTSSPTITWVCHDSVSGISHASVSLDGGQFVICEDPYSVTLESVSEGDHDLVVRIYDIAGNYDETNIEFSVGSGGISSLAMPIAIGATAICITAFAVLFILRSRKRDTV